MTKRKDFKKLVRARMEKTGESYTAARRALLPESEGEYPGDPVADREHENEVMFFVYPPPEDPAPAPVSPEEGSVKVRGFMEPMPPQLAAKVQELRAEAKRAVWEEGREFMEVLEAMKPFHLSEEALKVAVEEDRAAQQKAADELTKQFAATSTQELGVMDPETGEVYNQRYYPCGCVLRYPQELRRDLKNLLRPKVSATQGGDGVWGADGIAALERVLEAQDKLHAEGKCAEAARGLKLGTRYNLLANDVLGALVDEHDAICYWPDIPRLRKPEAYTLYYQELMHLNLEQALQNREIDSEEYAYLSEKQFRNWQSRREVQELIRAPKAASEGPLLGFEVVELD